MLYDCELLSVEYRVSGICKWARDTRTRMVHLPASFVLQMYFDSRAKANVL